jgi:proliferating cell nuclear antigen PCNA
MICVWKSSAQCLKILKAIQHTNKMVNFKFDENGIHVMSMDMSKSSLVCLELESCELEKFECNNNITLGLYTEVLVNILQKAKKNKVIWQTLDDFKMKITFVDNAQKTEFILRTIDIDNDKLAVPELDDDMALRVPREILKDWMDKMLMTNEDVEFNITPQLFSCQTNSTELGIVRHTEPIGTDRIQSLATRNDVNAKFSSYVTKSISIFALTGGDTCILGFSNEQPSRIKVLLGDDSYICLYFAPKITDD